MDFIKTLLVHSVVFGGILVVGTIGLVSSLAISRQRSRTRSMERLGLVLLCVAMVSTLVGCGKSTGRLAVSGEVTLDGQAIESGSILFQPKGEGPKVGARIKEGKYRFDTSDGPLTGEYKVEIYADAKDPFPMDDPEAFAEQMEKDPEALQPTNAVPAYYNSRSTLTADPNPQKLTFNFNLKKENND